MTIEHDYWYGNEKSEVMFLDAIDDDWWEKSVLIAGKTVCQMLCIIADQWNDSYRKINNEDLFNWLSEEELQEYIETRFHRKFREVSYYILV